MHSHVVIVGSYVQDHAWQVDNFPVPGETRRALGFSSGPGGKGFNQAIACARQGVDTVFIGAIGQDALGECAKNFAAAESLRAYWQIRSDMPTAASSIVVNAHGENMIAVNLAANEFLDVDFLQAQASSFETASIVLCQLENNLDAVAFALTLGKKNGALCVLNPAPVHPELNHDLLTTVDVLTPNETEFALLCQRFTTSDLSGNEVALAINLGATEMGSSQIPLLAQVSDPRSLDAILVAGYDPRSRAPGCCRQPHGFAQTGYTTSSPRTPKQTPRPSTCVWSKCAGASLPQELDPRIWHATQAAAARSMRWEC